MVPVELRIKAKVFHVAYMALNDLRPDMRVTLPTSTGTVSTSHSALTPRTALSEVLSPSSFAHIVLSTWTAFPARPSPQVLTQQPFVVGKTEFRSCFLTRHRDPGLANSHFRISPKSQGKGTLSSVNMLGTLPVVGTGHRSTSRSVYQGISKGV